ncbi:MAG TPA: hypothetical protein VMV61_05410 [Patescibacteria group bacterium]|nr:hypothetical protein [Patescibacteria group bacterium]
MKPKMFSLIVLGCFALLAAPGASWAARAQDAKSPYPRMAPIEQYRMERSAEIALARTAAPASISNNAGVMVLGRHGYETAVSGKNGFICVVERAWNAPFDAPEFWNPKIRGPDCYNPQAVRSILPLILKRAEWALAGLSKDQMRERAKALAEKKELPPVEPGAMTYMMSKEAYLTDEGDHNMSHLMFYLPKGTDWGVGPHGSPVMQGQKDIVGTPEPITEFLIPVLRWSDGTPQIVGKH